MTVRLIKIAEVEVGMITLERQGRARVMMSRPCYGENGHEYQAYYIEGPYSGKPTHCKGILENTLWIEESLP